MDVPQHISEFFDKLPEFPPKPASAGPKYLGYVCASATLELQMELTTVGYELLYGREPLEQSVLRAHHGAPYEYVYSELLGGHVRIGERA